MSYLLPVTHRHLWFSTYPDIGQYCHLSLRMARPRKQGYCRWNFVPMLSASWDIGTSGLKGAILDSTLSVRPYNNTDSPIGQLDLENIVIAVPVGILFPSWLQAEIEVYSVLEATILDFSPPLKSHNIFCNCIGLVDPKNIDLGFEISFFCFPRTEIYVFKLKVPVWSPPSWISTSGQAVQYS